VKILLATLSLLISFATVASNSSGPGFNGGSGSFWTTYFDSDTLDYKLARFIAGAEHSLDICFYEIFRDTVAKAIITAGNRGVKVRVITDSSYYFRAYMDSMRAHGIPVIHEGMGPNSTGHIMHNKFVVRDYRDADTTNDYLWTGSYNASEYTRLNAENVIIINSHAVATPYFFEFNQMWGDTGDIPDTLLCRTGSRKIEVYPQHLFVVNGDSIWVYFSPQNRPIQFLVDFVSNSADSIGYLIYSYTRHDLADAMAEAFQRGVFIGGVHDASDVGSPSSVFRFLADTVGLPVYRDRLPSDYGLLHHKMMVIDREIVITGSMNWSNNGNEENDENTIIIKNRNLAELYWQEFKMRYSEAVGVREETIAPSLFILFIGNKVAFDFYGYRVYDLSGRLITESEDSNEWRGLDLRGEKCPQGIYIVIPKESNIWIKILKVN